MAKWDESSIPDLSGQRMLITGAASGIGFEAARALAAHNADIIIIDRNEQAGHAALARIIQAHPKAKVEFRVLDLSDLQSVKDFAATLLAEGKPLDVLVNNAGIQPISERRTSSDGFELTFAIGHLAHFTLTALLLPLLNAAPAGRVVTVSSMVHGQGRLDWDDLQIEENYRSQRAYNQTKLANLLFARELQRRLEASGSAIKSIAVHPGVAQTAIGANRKRLGQFKLGDHIVTAVLSVVMPNLGQSAVRGALPTMYAASSPQAQGGGFYGPDGFGEMKGAPGPARIKGLGQDMESAARLWDITEQLVGVRPSFGLNGAAGQSPSG